jgi:hypothetical protein
MRPVVIHSSESSGIQPEVSSHGILQAVLISLQPCRWRTGRGGRPKGYLSETVEHVCKKLIEQGKTGLLKPSKIREFIIAMKEMATRNGRHADEYVLERIKAIQIPDEGLCTIMTQDNIILKGQSETIHKGKSYANNDIAKILSKLRKNNLISA